MYKKKFGRMTVGAWLNSEMERSSPVWMLLCGTLLVLLGIAVRVGVGSPYPTLVALSVGEMVPPAWLMLFLWTLSFFVIGCAFSFVLGYRGREGQVEKYKGGMLFVLLAVLELCWYPTFFRGGYVFFSAMLALLILCLGICVMNCFYRVSKFAGALMLLHNIWLVYGLLLNFTVLFCA